MQNTNDLILNNNTQRESKILDPNDNEPSSIILSNNPQTQTSIIARPPKIYIPPDTNESSNTDSKKTTNSKVSTIIVIEDSDLIKEGKTHCEITTNQDIENLSVSEKTIIIVNDPRNWNASRKRFILFLVAFAGFISPISCTFFFPAINDVRKDLNTSEILANSLVAVYIFFWGISPLGWASYSDSHATRRKVYLFSFILFVISSVLCALLNNIWLLLAMRALQSCGASAAMCIGAGVITDIFRAEERGTAYGLFFIGPLLGPLIGPLIGGYINEYLNWRWIFWSLAIIGFLMLLLIFFFLPETFRQPSSSPTSTPKKRFRPITPLLLLRYPFVSMIITYVSSICVLLFLYQTLVPTSFAIQYNLSSSEIGLVLFANGIGFIVGSVLGGRYSDYVLMRAKKECGEEYPEMRLQSVWLGAAMVPVGMLAFGWLTQANFALAWNLVAMVISAIGAMIIFSATATYLVDALPTQSASAIAVYHCIRLIIGAIASGVAQTVDSAIGTGWTYTIPSIICIFCTALVALVSFYGRQWRKKYADGRKFEYVKYGKRIGMYASPV
ncbi:7102_t:CDS:10 [Ambispora gerdemannii]|uniref:7102_t:CDS:1 n=1 Tax=Ambispora gerdemannii TaxID=144530 RepID=A0A9N9A5M8_9GLOM|nr:7102_t:CDS:10 [Ambispora gerdemannii]